MLVHSPFLPLIIDYRDGNRDLVAEDEEVIMLALKHRDRMGRIYLQLPVPSLQKLIPAIEGDFPALEILRIGPAAKHNTRLMLSPTFKAQQLRHPILDHFTSPFGSPFLTSAVGLATLLLLWINLSMYLHPNILLQSLSLLPQLEILQLGFLSPVPNREIESQLSHTPITTQIALPNFRLFRFQGNSAYLEAFLLQMAAPLLKTLSIYFFDQLSFSVPRLLQFMSTTKRFEFSRAQFLFYPKGVVVFLQPPAGARLTNFYVGVTCEHFDWQISSAASYA